MYGYAASLLQLSQRFEILVFRVSCSSCATEPHAMSEGTLIGPSSARFVC
jgi:hypothetical protein